MEMIDVLTKLKEIAEKKPELVKDAVENVEKTNPKVDEGKMKDMIMSFVDKYSKYAGNNGDLLPEGYIEYATNTGIPTDAMETNEVDEMMKKYGDAFDEDPMAYINEMPITKAFMDELNEITGSDDLENNAEILQQFVESKDTVEELVGR